MQYVFSRTSFLENYFHLCYVSHSCGFYPESDPASGALQHPKKKKYRQELPNIFSAELRWTHRE